MRQITVTSAGFADGHTTVRYMRVWPLDRPGAVPIVVAHETVPGRVTTDAGELRQLARWLEKLADDLDGR